MFSSHVLSSRSLSPSTFPPWLLISASQSMPPPPQMDRLRDLAARSSRRVECRFRIPKSLSTTSLMLHKTAELDEGSDDATSDAVSTVSSTSASAVLAPTTCLPGSLGSATPSLQSDPAPTPSLPSASGTRTTQTQPRAQRGISTTGMQTPSTNKGSKQHRMRGNAPSVADREADQRLFDQALASIAQNDVIANSGHELYRRVNDCARDYIEAKQIVERREHEIAAISAKIEAMQATADEATKHLHKAKELAAEIIDSSVAEQFRLRERDNLINILIGMTNAIANADCHNWPRDKVNKYLEDLQAVFHKNKYYCQSAMVSSGIVHVAKHFVFHTDYDDAFEPMLFHLANQTDYKGFVERARREDQEFVEQHHVDYSARPNAAPRTKTSAPTSNNEGPKDKAKGIYYGDDAAAPHGASDDAAGAAQAKLDGRDQEPLQKLTPLPPRSSSLPSSARKTPADQATSNVVLPDPCGKSAYRWKQVDFETSADLKKLAEEIFSELGPHPGDRVTSGAMRTAVLESIAGVEAIFKNGMDRESPELKKEVTSTVKLMKWMNKEHVKSEQVDRKLGAVAETHDCCSIQPDEASGGRIHVDVTMAGSYLGCAPNAAKQVGPETKATHGDEAFRHGEDMRGSGEDSDLLWKAYVSGIASAKP